MGVWYLVNKNINNSDFSVGSFSFLTEDKNGLLIKDDMSIYIEGYILPRQNLEVSKPIACPKEFILELYRKYGVEFIQHIKGFFTIIILKSSGFEIYNDYSGVNKFFWNCSGNDLIISNSLKQITSSNKVTVNLNHLAIFAVMEHFVGGITAFQNVYYSTPAQLLKYSGNLEVKNYFDYGSILQLPLKPYSYKEFASEFKSLINDYLFHLQPGQITMTLTGGNDSRAILAALLSEKIKPRTFFFGNPLSYDGVVANKIAKSENLILNHYFESAPNSEWFARNAEALVKEGNAMINIHRAHRIDAIQKELLITPKADALFAGFMGGDYIRGINYDDYITPKIVRLYYQTGLPIKDLLIRILKEKEINTESVDLDYISDFLGNEKYFSEKKQKHREFYLNTQLVGPVHDYQDTFIFMNHVKYAVNIFMDIDFLESLFSTKYSMLHKEHTSKNYISRIHEPEFICNLLNEIYPSLTKIEFSKYYKPDEYLKNAYWSGIKKIFKSKWAGNKIQGFSYELWFKEYLLNEYQHIELEIEELFKVEKIKEMLKTYTHQNTEGYWHTFSNPVNLNKIIHHYQ